LGRQLRLELDRVLRPSREDFVVSAANADAVRLLDGWPAWPGGVLALVGPPGSGKSHLAAAWTERAGASRWDGVGLPDGPTLVEDADRALAGEPLFHLLNGAAHGGGLLLTARTRPSTWTAALPDLRSRLNALVVAELDEPDDAVLSGVLTRLFAERSIRPPEDLIPYLIRRIERSVPHARAVVARLDDEAAALHRPVTRALAREVLEASGDLFD
jgi:chromosomal replication initiation ATPase DnaA